MKLLDGMIHSFENIGYGVGLAVVIAAILLFIVFAIRKGNQISPFSYVVAVILVPVLALQFSLMFGAISVQKKIKTVENSIDVYSQLLEQNDDTSEFMDGIYDIIDKYQSVIPGLFSENGTLEIGQIDRRDVGGSLLAPAKSYVSKYLRNRILLAILFTFVAMAGVILLADVGGPGSYHRTASRRGRERVPSRRESSSRRSARRTRRY